MCGYIDTIKTSSKHLAPRKWKNSKFIVSELWIIEMLLLTNSEYEQNTCNEKCVVFFCIEWFYTTQHEYFDEQSQTL